MSSGSAVPNPLHGGDIEVPGRIATVERCTTIDKLRIHAWENVKNKLESKPCLELPRLGGLAE